MPAQTRSDDWTIELTDQEIYVVRRGDEVITKTFTEESAKGLVERRGKPVRRELRGA